MAAVFFGIPHFFIRALYGPTFLGAVPILQWMGVAMIFIGVLQLWTDYYLARLK
jgi:O-antigen/teichoic acid export membrane protein